MVPCRKFFASMSATGIAASAGETAARVELVLAGRAVAAQFHVDPRTGTRARAGKLTTVRDGGAHRHYRLSELSPMARGTRTAR
jgi:hypothetical protein